MREETATEARAVGSVLLFLVLLAATGVAGYHGLVPTLFAGLCESECEETLASAYPWLGATAVLAGAAFWALLVAIQQARTPLRGRDEQRRS